MIPAVKAPVDDFDIQSQAIDRRRQMAAALMGAQMPQGRMVGNVYVNANPLEYLAAGLKQYAGRKDMEMADADQRALGQQVQQRNAGEVQGIIQALRGTPAQFRDGESMGSIDPSLEGFGPIPEQTAAAVPADPQRAMAMALASRNPAMQQVGAALLKQTMATPESMFGKVDPKDYTAESVARFAQTRNHADLVPVRKREFVNGQAVDPFAAPIGTVIPKQLAPDSIVTVGPDGRLIPNAPVVDAKGRVAAAGKPVTNVSVNTATKPMLTEIGKGVGEQITNDFAGARSAAGTLNNVSQIRQGLGSAILGPGANVRIKLAQVGEVLGINGKDATEQLQNTRNVMQGLARQELAAAGQMKGQGQITESERAILRKAESGQIDELTAPELRTLLGALERTAKYRMSLHNQNLERLKKDPAAAGVVDYMRVDAPDAGGFRIIGTE